MPYRTLESVLHPDSHLALPTAELPQRPVRVMVTILEDNETDNHADGCDIDAEHRKWVNEQLREALEDPAEGFPITPEFFENWRREIEEKLAKGTMA